ncbi:hypothetical protein LX64_01832 [Chitinophaga skermanii]|uniref:Uncharacterized protein n=1 Tax=Chitinophaga skermanii TaxID=331697 RepID=A0A327QS34_9BACT|nr:hypothetical protein [Chitinophaga skermanii]RAJ06705.1 hypothetical protein LX64_01832 [Chitinophaga skermanii]
MGKIVPMGYKHLEKVAFYPTRNGYLAVTKQRKIPKWGEKIKDHRAAFGKTAQMAADLYAHFQPTRELVRDKGMYRRLSSHLMKVLQSDATNIRGERTAEYGDVAMMAGFEYNNKVKFNRVFTAEHTITLDRARGMAEVKFPAFNAHHEVHAPKHATHFKLIASLHAVNFHTQQITSHHLTSQTLPLHATIDAFSMALEMAKFDPRHVFISVGIAFIEVENGQEYPIKGGVLNAMAIRKVFVKAVVAQEKGIVSAEEIIRQALLPKPSVPPKKRSRALQVGTKKHTRLRKHAVATPLVE